MDIKWIIDEQINVVKNGRSSNIAAVEGILNSLLMMEAENIQQYQYSKQGISELFTNEPLKMKVLLKLIDNIIENKRNHIESLSTATAIISGKKEPEAKEYYKAVKEDD